MYYICGQGCITSIVNTKVPVHYDEPNTYNIYVYVFFMLALLQSRSSFCFLTLGPLPSKHP